MQAKTTPGVRRARPPIALVAGIIALGVAVSSAWALTADGSHDSPTGQALAERDAVSPRDTPEALTRHFGALRGAPDGLPAEVQAASGDVSAAAFAPNPDLAVGVNLPEAVSRNRAWLVPGDDALCLFVPDTEGWAGSCAAAADAVAGQLSVVLLRGDSQTVVGVAPDGVDSASLSRAGGSVIKLDVIDNVYAGRTTGAVALTVGSSMRDLPRAPRLQLPADGPAKLPTP